LFVASTFIVCCNFIVCQRVRQIFVKANGLFWASLVYLVGSLFLRLFNSLRLRKRVQEGKFFTFVLVEPNSGMELVKAALIDQEAGSQGWDHRQQKYVTLDKDPVAVMSHVDFDAGTAEANNILVMVFGEDIPETVISVIYAIKLGSELDRVFAVSAAGTILHLAFQLSEYWLIHQHLPALRQLAEGRDTNF
jgi:hypothetical protein